MWLVCRDKETEKYFICQRKARETALKQLSAIGQQINSTVLKSFEKYSEANDYKKRLENGNDILNKTNHP